MFSEDGGRPNDQRHFVHKKLLGVAKTASGFIPGISTAVGIGSTALGVAKRARSFFRGTARPTVPRTQTARVTATSTAQKQLGADLKFGFDAQPQLFTTDVVRRGPGGRRFGGGGNGGNGDLQSGPCDFPKVRDRQGRCRTPTSGEFGGEQFGVGEAVMGRYGAALEPGSMIVDRAVCLRGMQLGDDGLCYNKSQISNKQRMWPAGRKPLLSGGDMRAINIAAKAGRRLDSTTKRLRRLGMMKALPAPRKKPAAHQHAQASTAVVSVP